MSFELAARGTAVEHERVERHAGEPHPQAIDDSDETERLAVDAGLLLDLLHRDLGRRVADVGPAGGIQPDPRVRALHQQDLAQLVPDHSADGDLRGHVSRHAFTDAVEPFLHEVPGLSAHFEVLVSRRADVRCDLEHLLEPLSLVEALREAESRPRDSRQRLTPTQEVLSEVRRTGGRISHRAAG